MVCVVDIAAMLKTLKFIIFSDERKLLWLCIEDIVFVCLENKKQLDNLPVIMYVHEILL
jgi:hypothetical protein